MPSLRQQIAEVLRTTPKRFQIKGVRFLERRKGRAILGDDMGLGKTFQFITYAALHPELRPLAVVCPASLKYNWQAEFWKHAHLESEVLEGTRPRALDGDIWILNYDIARAWLPSLKGKIKLLGIDECQKIMNRQALRTKACRSLARGCRHIIPMSGTPIVNRPIEFFPVLQMVNPKVFNSFWDYAMTYCAPKRGFRGRGWDLTGASNLEDLHSKVQPIMIRRTKTEVLKDLPPKVRTVIPIKITNHKEYERARDEFIEWLATTKGVKAARRAKGAVALVRLGALKRLVAEGKLTTLRDWIVDWRAETREKLVVFTTHKSVTRSLGDLFPKALIMDGDVPNRHRQGLVTTFQTDPTKWLIIGTIHTLGTGHTLTAASTVAICEMGWTPGEHDQAEDRVLRIGQKADRMNAYYFVGRNTVEEDIIDLLDRKRNIISQVLDGRTEENVLAGVLERLVRKDHR